MPENVGPSVLLVEDEYLIASALRDLFEQKGARVIGPVAEVSAALDLIAKGQRIDCALLDVCLGDELVFPVAEALRARSVRFAFMTGYERSVVPDAYREAPFLSKAGDSKSLLRWVLGSEAPLAQTG